MGLDAFVFCDCYESGRLLELLPPGVSLRIQPDGSLVRECDGTPESDLAWDIWREHRACEHRGGMLLHRRLGNIGLVGLLRAELQREASRFPILLTQVVYNGSHTGDFLSLETIPSLQRELELLGKFKCSTRDADGFMAKFRVQMSELAATALSISKPISF